MGHKISRRALAGLAAAAALGAQAPQAPQTPRAETAPPLPANAEEELASARTQNKNNAALIARVPLPMDTEPAVHFKAF